MPQTAHNPDQFMMELGQVLAQGRKRIGFLIGAGAPVGIRPKGKPLIPAIAELTEQVRTELLDPHKTLLAKVASGFASPPNIEALLSHARTLSGVLRAQKLDGSSATDFSNLAHAICAKIGKIVSVPLPLDTNAYTELAGWIGGVGRTHSIEIFTPNYDLLFEEAFERARLPFFDGFSGAIAPFFDAATVSADDLPARWTKIWKIHGSLGWSANSTGEVVKTYQKSATQLIYPELQKYDQIQKQPYAALFERLRTFIATPDTILVVSGLSFADAHISSVIDESLSVNQAGAVAAFQFRELKEEKHVVDLASRRSNLSVFCPDAAVIGGIAAPWKPGELPNKDWEGVRQLFWDAPKSIFKLGDYSSLVRFIARTAARQIADSPKPSGATP